MDRDWDLSLSMTERYHWAHSVMHHHNELKVTKCLVTGSCIMVRVKWLAGNETERGIGIPTIESQASNVSIDKGNCIRDYLNPQHRGSSDEIIVEHVGANMGIQIPLSTTSNVHSQETMTICWPTSQSTRGLLGTCWCLLFTHVLRFPDNTIIAWIKDNYHE